MRKYIITILLILATATAEQIGYKQIAKEAAIKTNEKFKGTEQGTTNKTTDKWKVKYIKEDAFGKKGEKMPVDFSELNLTEEEIKEIKQDIIWTYQSEKNNAKEKLKEDILKLIGTYEVEYNDRIHELTINAENLIMTTKTY